MSRTPTLTAAFALGRLAFGAGLVASPEKVASGWLGAGILSDLSDVLSTLVTPGSVLPGNARWRTVALGGGSALTGAALIAAMDR